MEGFNLQCSLAPPISRSSADTNTIILPIFRTIPDSYQFSIYSSPYDCEGLRGTKDVVMPAIRSHAARGKKPPAGFDDIRDDLEVFGIKMKDAQNTPTNNVPKHQAQWPIFQIAHQRSRYVYELYYEKEAISKQLYDWLLKNGYADPILIAKWKKQGYEKVRLLWLFFSLLGAGGGQEAPIRLPVALFVRVLEPS
jgi:bud site selection protein 31